MTFLQTLARIRLNLTRPRRPLTPYFVLKGRITPEMTYLVSQYLQKIPKRSKKLGVIITSAGGDVSQAVLIADKLKRKAKQCDLELVTFAQQFSLNSAFFLLLQGNRVYSDRTTILGGLEIGESKLNLGIFSQYIKTFVYAEDSSFVAEKKRDEPYSEQKAAEMKQLYQKFGQQMKAKIIEARKSKLQNPQQIDFTKYFMGDEALKLGLIDGIGRVHETIPKLIENPYIQLVRENPIDQLVSDLRKIQLKR